MAAYSDIQALFSDATLLARFEVAVLVTAQQVLADETALTEQIAWARHALVNTSGVAAQVLKATLAAFKDLTVAQINNATDASLQGAVDAVAPRLTLGFKL